MPEPERCANCSQPLTGPYCSACGEKRLSHHDLSLSHFAQHVLHDLTHFDAKFLGSLVPLFLKPGFLTAEFVAGRWKAYIKPTTLFILINVFFFFSKGGINELDRPRRYSGCWSTGTGDGGAQGQ
jgi:hypothetical protein